MPDSKSTTIAFEHHDDPELWLILAIQRLIYTVGHDDRCSHAAIVRAVEYTHARLVASQELPCS